MGTVESNSATTGRQTDHRNLDLTALNMDVIRGRAGGKVLWQPRILAWLSDRRFRGEPLPPPYTGLSKPELYRALGCSNRIYDHSQAFASDEDPAVRTTHRELNATDYEVLIETPVGNQRAVYRRSPNNPWHEPLKWPIRSPAELKVAAWREVRRTWRWDQAAFEAVSAEWTGLGAPTACMPRASIQKLIVEEMGVEGTAYGLADWPGACEEYFEALAVSHDRLIEVICGSPIEIINFGDNVDARVTSPRLFERYLLPVYRRRCERLHASGKFVHAHWDGAVGPLLPYARETGLDGIEAITPRPQGDVTLEQARAALGEMFLLDGIPAILFDNTYSEAELADCARRCIDLFAPNLVLGISDEISSTGELERIRLVGQIVDDYNAAL